MKFIIYATSGEPIDYPGLKWIEDYKTREFWPSQWQEFIKEGTDHKVISDKIWTRVMPIWKYEIELKSLDDLLDLFDHVGPIIVSREEIEVYDDHHS